MQDAYRGGIFGFRAAGVMMRETAIQISQEIQKIRDEIFYMLMMTHVILINKNYT